MGIPNSRGIFQFWSDRCFIGMRFYIWRFNFKIPFQETQRLICFVSDWIYVCSILDCFEEWCLHIWNVQLCQEDDHVVYKRSGQKQQVLVLVKNARTFYVFIVILFILLNYIWLENLSQDATVCECQSASGMLYQGKLVTIKMCNCHQPWQQTLPHCMTFCNCLTQLSGWRQVCSNDD